MAERIDEGCKCNFTPFERKFGIFSVGCFAEIAVTHNYIAANRLKVDFAHYITNQLMSPIQQLYGLALEQIWELQKKPTAIKKHRQEIAELEQKWPDPEELVKRKDTFCSKKVKPLLFDKWLTQINNDKNRLQPISGFFQKK
jgi:hypothetical protein